MKSLTYITKISTIIVLAAGLMITNGCGSSSSYTENDAPTADAGVDRTVATGSNVTLDGSGSNDSESGYLTFYWEINSKPSSSNVILSDATHATPSKMV